MMRAGCWCGSSAGGGGSVVTWRRARATHRHAQRLRQAAERDELGNVSQLVGDEYESVLEDPLPAALTEGSRRASSSLMSLFPVVTGSPRAAAWLP
jgi:hypothetical protein